MSGRPLGPTSGEPTIVQSLITLRAQASFTADIAASHDDAAAGEWRELENDLGAALNHEIFGDRRKRVGGGVR